MDGAQDNIDGHRIVGKINKAMHKKLKKLARQHGGFHPRKLKIVACDDKLTAAAGLGAM